MLMNLNRFSLSLPLSNLNFALFTEFERHFLIVFSIMTMTLSSSIDLLQIMIAVQFESLVEMSFLAKLILFTLILIGIK